jgi:hypothetical protein
MALSTVLFLVYRFKAGAVALAPTESSSLA